MASDYTSTREDQEFKAQLLGELNISDEILPTLLSWIENNLVPSQVFEKGSILEWVKDTCYPEDVFDNKSLVAWAEENEFTKNE